LTGGAIQISCSTQTQGVACFWFDILEPFRVSDEERCPRIHLKCRENIRAETCPGAMVVNRSSEEILP